MVRLPILVAIAALLFSGPGLGQEDVVRGLQTARALVDLEILDALAWQLGREDDVAKLRALRAAAELKEGATPLLELIGRRLRDANQEVRFEAAATLGCIGQAAVPLLRRELAAKETERRFVAALALGVMGPAGAEAAPDLIGVLDDGEADVRRKAAYALGRMAPRAVQAVAALARLHADKDEAVVIQAHQALLGYDNLALPVIPDLLDLPTERGRGLGVRLLEQRLGESAKAALPYLIKGVRHRHKDVRLGCLQALRLTTAAPVAPLAELLDDPAADIRFKALAVLVKQEAVGQARPALEKALLDPHEPVQQLAADGLSGLKSDPWAFLFKALERPSAQDRFHAARFLIQRFPDSKPVLDGLLRVLREEKELRMSAAYALGRTKRPESKPAIPVLVEELRDKDHQVRHSVLQILYYILPHDPDAVLPAMPPLLKDANVQVREMTAMVLSRFGKQGWHLVLQMAKDEQHPGVRSVLYNAVGENVRDTDALLPFLMDAALKETAEEAKRGAIWSLNWFEAKTVGGFLHKLYKQEKNRMLRETILHLAGRFGVHAGPLIPLFIDGLKDSEPRMRELAANGLRFINPPARAAIPALKRALNDANEDVRQAAAAALEAIQK